MPSVVGSTDPSAASGNLQISDTAATLAPMVGECQNRAWKLRAGEQGKTNRRYLAQVIKEAADLLRSKTLRKGHYRPSRTPPITA